MKTKINFSVLLALAITLVGPMMTIAQPSSGINGAPARPQGPCDIYAAAGDPCVAAHSSTRALYASYNGALYQILRQSDGKTLDIGVVQPVASPAPDAGGYANAAAQDAFCANTYCWISKLYDQSSKHNDLIQAPRGGFSGPAMGGFNNLPIADMAPVTIMGHKAYGVFIAPGMGLRQNDAKGTAVDDQAEGTYWVTNGLHFNGGCCFDYGNAEIDSRDDDNGTMETAYYGDNSGPWFHGAPPGPWIMTDQENNLVGCVNPDGNKLCSNLPTVTWRFVTAIAKGEPHHWTSMGGDAQQGTLQVMFNGQRVNSSYDPMRKQGAILLGNGGDNSNSSQGTFYEGALTASGTFPTDATDQLVQANVVAAKYAVQTVSLAPASAIATPPGLQTFSPGSSQDTTVTFTNTTAVPATGVKLSITLPKQWTSVASGATNSSKTFTDPVAPGASVSATFKVTSRKAAFNGDLIGNATWANVSGGKHSETIAEKVRNVSPIKLNEFRISSGPPTNSTDSFIELFNAGSDSADLSNWTLTEHPIQTAIFSTVKIPAGTKLPAGGFYLFGLSNSGLAIPTSAGDATINLRSTTGMSAGDTVSIDTGSNAESRKIATLGTAATVNTKVWQPTPEGGAVVPIITIPVGSTNVPVASVSGFVVGEKIALGYGATYPTVAKTVEKYEVATVTAVGKPGTQAYLASDAPSGATNIQVTSLANISVGDNIRLDIDSPGHGIETVTVTKVGTQANHTTLAADAAAGATNVKVRNMTGFAVGDKIIIGTPANLKTYTITAAGPQGPTGTGLDFTPAFADSHASGESAVVLGTGLDLAAPLKFNHAANLPFSNRGTGISFQPATAFAHSSNEPVQALGTGITLDSPLDKGHAIDAVVRDATVTSAGYQGTPEPNQWFGGPVLSTIYVSFDNLVSISAGNMVLRDASGLAVDSLNYGGIVDPWASEGYQATSGPKEGGCFVSAPGPAGFGPVALWVSASNTSSGRFPDGHDADNNCTDFLTAPATSLSGPSVTGATNIKVASVARFDAGQTIRIDTGASLETAVIGKIGTAGGTTLSAATTVGATVIPVISTIGFSSGQTITIGDGANSETAVVSYFTRRGSGLITFTAPLTLAHPFGAQLSGTGITLTTPLTLAHTSAAQVAGSSSTPGAPNRYFRKPQ